MQKRNRKERRTRADLEIEMALYANLINKKPFTPRETELFSKAMDRGIRSAMREAAKSKKQ